MDELLEKIKKLVTELRLIKDTSFRQRMLSGAANALGELRNVRINNFSTTDVIDKIDRLGHLDSINQKDLEDIFQMVESLSNDPDSKSVMDKCSEILNLARDRRSFKEIKDTFYNPNYAYVTIDDYNNNKSLREDIDVQNQLRLFFQYFSNKRNLFRGEESAIVETCLQEAMRRISGFNFDGRGEIFGKGQEEPNSYAHALNLEGELIKQIKELYNSINKENNKPFDMDHSPFDDYQENTEPAESKNGHLDNNTFDMDESEI